MSSDHDHDDSSDGDSVDSAMNKQKRPRWAGHRQKINVLPAFKTPYLQQPNLAVARLQEPPPLLANVNDVTQHPMYLAYSNNPELARAMVTANQNLVPVPPSMPVNNAPTDVTEEASKKKRKAAPLVPLPECLKNFTYPKDKDRIKLAEEFDKSNEENPGPYEIAKFVTVEGKEDIDLDKLLSHQLRELAISFGCKGCGSLSKFKVRLSIARRIRMGTQYENCHIPDVGGNQEQKRVNSLIRLINVVFHPDNIDRFLKLNDTLSRGDFESAPAASNPIQAFWMEISEAYNDTELSDEYSMVLGSEEGQDEHLHDKVIEDIINPRDFNIMTRDSCKQSMKDLMRARNQVYKQSKVSGNHATKVTDFLRKTHLTVRSKVVMPKVPVYCLYHCCKEHDAVDAAYTETLDASLKSDSALVGDDSDDDKEKKGKSKKEEVFLAAINESSESMRALQLAANQRTEEQRQEMIDLKKLEIKKLNERQLWDEYSKWSDKLIELYCEEERCTDENKLPDIRRVRQRKNMAKRVLELEEALNLCRDDSVVSMDDM